MTLEEAQQLTSAVEALRRTDHALASLDEEFRGWVELRPTLGPHAGLHAPELRQALQLLKTAQEQELRYLGVRV